MGYTQCAEAQEQVDEKYMCPKCLYKRAYIRYSKTMEREEYAIALLGGLSEQERNNDEVIAEFGSFWFLDHLDVLGIPKNLPNSMLLILSVAFAEALVDAAKKLREGKDATG